MASKTYVPTAIFWIHFTHKYLTRWQAKLQANLTTEQYNCVVDLIQALASCIVLISPPAPGP